MHDDAIRQGTPAWQTHAVFAVVANAGMAGLWALTRDRTPGPGDEGAGYWWPLWTALVWGLLVALHYLHATDRLRRPPAPTPKTDPWVPALPPDPTPPPAAGPLQTLTRREREILTLLAQGHPNKTIAERLFITERTTRTHVSNILRKLELPSRTQAALLAVQAGLNTNNGQSHPS